MWHQPHLCEITRSLPRRQSARELELRIKCHRRLMCVHLIRKAAPLPIPANLYCNPVWVNFTAQYGLATPPPTLHFCPFTEPAARVEK